MPEITERMYTTIEAVALAALFAFAFWALDHYWGVWRLLKSILRVSLWGRSTRMRVSFSAILRISQGDQFLLAAMKAHRWAFGPFGGVYHFYEGASELLHECEFTPKSNASNPRDLRGFLPRRHFARLLRWFFSERDRESAEKCLQRELREELHEVGEDSFVRSVDTLHFRFVRSVIEPPRKVSGQDHLQFRCFHVYEVDTSFENSAAFATALLDRARNHPKMRVATTSEIVTGRLGNDLIGHHAEYLFNRKASRQVLPPANFQDT